MKTLIMSKPHRDLVDLHDAETGAWVMRFPVGTKKLKERLNKVLSGHPFSEYKIINQQTEEGGNENEKAG